MKYTVTFPIDCPFSDYMRYGKAQGKSFVRTINNVEYAARLYNRANNTNIHFHSVRTFDNGRVGDNIVAIMYFYDDNDNTWVIVIREYD